VWLRAVRVLAELDCLFSLAKGTIALGEPSCRPEFVEGDEAFVEFEELRHPMLAMSSSVKEFIPNDVRMGGEVGRITLLTGKFLQTGSDPELTLLSRSEYGVCDLCLTVPALAKILFLEGSPLS
jgi:hypothetical protein